MDNAKTFICLNFIKDGLEMYHKNALEDIAKIERDCGTSKITEYAKNSENMYYNELLLCLEKVTQAIEKNK